MPGTNFAILLMVPVVGLGLFALDTVLKHQKLTKPTFDLESKKLYSYDKKETHCPDREMIHPCTTELSRYLKDSDPEGADAAFDCAQTVLELKKDDFQVMKNMTHLLLDLDATDHHFDQENNRQNRFYQLGLDFGKRTMDHPDCLADFDNKSELECRCPHLYGKILLLKLKNAGRWDEAQKLFDELKSMEWSGSKRQYKKGEAFRWDSIMHTPQIYIKGLASTPVWGEDRRRDLPIWDVLEKNFALIKNETLAAFNTSYVEDTYRFLYKEGNWNQIVLASGRKFTEACEKITPGICALMKKALPARKVHHYPWTSDQNEQVLLLRMLPGTDVEVHSGPANNILNVHLGISGVDGAVLQVANQTYGWEEGKVIAWDGSYDHTVDCKKCKQDRIIMMVRYMHPDMSAEHYRGSKRTHYEEIPESLFGGGAAADNSHSVDSSYDDDLADEDL